MTNDFFFKDVDTPGKAYILGDSKSQWQFLIRRVSAEIKLCEPRQALQRLVALIHMPIDLPRGKVLHMFLLFAECLLHVSPALSTLNVINIRDHFSAKNLLLSVAMRACIAPIHHRPHIRQPPAQRKHLRRTMRSSHRRQNTFYLRAVAASLRDFRGLRKLLRFKRHQTLAHR